MALYPPIVASSMPAFDIATNEVRIYFTLSSYNNKDDIKYIHCTVRRQSSNVNVLKGIEFKSVPFSEQGLTNFDKVLNRYYITINSSDLENGFEADVLYKVQLRFSTVKITSFTTSDANKYSEWSTVCIIKPIIAPDFYIDEFHIAENIASLEETNQNIFNSVLSDFTGVYETKYKKIQQGQTKEYVSSEVLRTWRIRLLDSSYTQENYNNIDQYTLADSGVKPVISNNYINIYDNALVLNCSLPYEMTNQQEYKVLFEIETKNGYEGKVLYPFKYSPGATDGITQGKIETVSNEQEGYIKVIGSATEVGFSGNIVLRRSDSSSNYLKWEDIKHYSFSNTSSENPISFTYYDFTVQSGRMYRYLMQKKDVYGRRGTPVYDQVSKKTTEQGAPAGAGTLAEWNHAFLLETSGNGSLTGIKQLKLKFDFQISSYKTNISESKTDTIGSKYPFIRRNGNMQYRSFSCSGTISEFMDDADLFTSKEQLFNGLYDNYVEYHGEIQNYVNKYDYTYERKFREKVEEFLYNNKPKLYKSTQEGNLIVKLMEVSLTPKNELGRLIYTFSATAYEIGDYNIENLIKYDFITPGTYLTKISNIVKDKLGQITRTSLNNNVGVFSSGENLLDAIKDKYHYGKSYKGNILKNYTIQWLRITIQSQHYLIENFNNSASPKEPLYQIYEDGYYLGTLLNIDDNDIIIAYPNYIYQIQYPLGPESTIIVKGDHPIRVSLDFIIDLEYEADTSSTPKAKRSNQVNGQLSGTYVNGTKNLINQIIYKYTREKTDSVTDKILNKQTVTTIKSLWLDTEQGTDIKVVLCTSDSNNRTYQEEQLLTVNHTGELHIDPHDTDTGIASLKILGKKNSQNIYEPVDALIFYDAMIGREYY